MLVTATFTRYTVSLQYTVGEYSKPSQLIATYRIVRNDGAYLDWDGMLKQMWDENVIPRPTVAPYTASAGLNYYMRCRGYTVQQVADGQGTGVVVTVNFDTMYTKHPTEVTRYDLPSKWEYNAITRTAPIYRRSWTGAPPAALDESAADIGGTAFGGGQVTRSQMVTQVRARLQFVQDATAKSMSVAATTLGTYAGTVNNATFGSFPAYTLVCEGVNIGKMDGEYYQVIFDFLYDPWYHHEQVATVDVDGRIKLTSGAPTEVKWKRQTRTAVDFNNIWAGDTILRDITNKGYI
jgi:hypothetical protein